MQWRRNSGSIRTDLQTMQGADRSCDRAVPQSHPRWVGCKATRSCNSFGFIMQICGRGKWSRTQTRVGRARVGQLISRLVEIDSSPLPFRREDRGRAYTRTLRSEPIGPCSHAAGHDAPWLIGGAVPAEAAMIEDVVVGFEHPVRQPLVAHDLPDGLDRVELGALWRQRHEGDIGGNDQRPRTVPPGLVEEQHGVRTCSGGHRRAPGRAQSDAFHQEYRWRRQGCLGHVPRQSRRARCEATRARQHRRCTRVGGRPCRPLR